MVKVPLLAASMICAAFVPKLTEAQVVNDRIRRLMHATRNSEAKNMAQSAIDAGIPLEPDVVSVLGGPSVLDENGRLEPFESWIQAPVERRNAPKIRLGNGDIILIWLPVLAFPDGKYMFRGQLPPRWVSMVGSGPTKSYLIVGFPGADGSPAFLNFGPGMIRDVLIFGFTAISAKSSGGSEASFIAVNPGSARVAVSGTVVDSLYQTLDRVIWDNVSFRNCTIRCQGDWFDLAEVDFVNCRFEFMDAVPAQIRESLQKGSDSKVTTRFHP
jgi:hypothetical protein